MSTKDKILKLVGYDKYTLLKKIYYKLFDPKRLKVFNHFQLQDIISKELSILNALRLIQSQNVNGLPNTYFEFGCHSGRTFSSAINATKFLKFPNFEFFAFDSFQGLPETNPEIDGNFFKSGQYYTTKDQFIKIIKKNTGVKLKQSNIFEGFYSDILNESLLEKLPSIGLVYIDCDLYSSSKEVLNFIKKLLMNGSIIMLDDYYCSSKSGSLKGQRHAFDEFLSENSEFQIEHYKNFSDFGAMFLVSKS